jgi:hypothetical protein
MTERDRITFYIMIGMQMTDRAKLLNQSCKNPVSAFVNHGQHVGQNAH